MTQIELKKILLKIDKSVKIIQDTPLCLRVLVYKWQKRYSIISKIRKIKTLQIVKISDYPDVKNFVLPITVLRVKRLQKPRKRQISKQIGIKRNDLQI